MYLLLDLLLREDTSDVVWLDHFQNRADAENEFLILCAGRFGQPLEQDEIAAILSNNVFEVTDQNLNETHLIIMLDRRDLKPFPAGPEQVQQRTFFGQYYANRRYNFLDAIRATRDERPGWAMLEAINSWGKASKSFEVNMRVEDLLVFCARVLKEWGGDPIGNAEALLSETTELAAKWQHDRQELHAYEVAHGIVGVNDYSEDDVLQRVQDWYAAVKEAGYIRPDEWNGDPLPNMKTASLSEVMEAVGLTESGT